MPEDTSSNSDDDATGSNFLIIEIKDITLPSPEAERVNIASDIEMDLAKHLTDFKGGSVTVHCNGRNSSTDLDRTDPDLDFLIVEIMDISLPHDETSQLNVEADVEMFLANHLRDFDSGTVTAFCNGRP